MMQHTQPTLLLVLLCSRVFVRADGIERGLRRKNDGSLTKHRFTAAVEGSWMALESQVEADVFGLPAESVGLTPESNSGSEDGENQAGSASGGKHIKSKYGESQTESGSRVKIAKRRKSHKRKKSSISGVVKEDIFGVPGIDGGQLLRPSSETGGSEDSTSGGDMGNSNSQKGSKHGMKKARSKYRKSEEGKRSKKSTSRGERSESGSGKKIPSTAVRTVDSKSKSVSHVDAIESREEVIADAINAVIESGVQKIDLVGVFPTAGPTVTTPNVQFAAEDTLVSSQSIVTELIHGDDGRVSTISQLQTDSNHAIESDHQTHNTLQCPLNGWPRFKMQSVSGDFIRYPLRKGHNASNAQAGEVQFSVSATCAYTIQEIGAENALTFTAPLEWLDMGVFYFSGVPGSRSSVSLSGAAAPTIEDVDTAITGSYVEVFVAANSTAVAGNTSLAWIFTSLGDAKEFEYFLNSIHRYAPNVFQTNDVMSCGRGPVCKTLGDGICFYNPITRELGAGNFTHGVYLADSMEWFKRCAELISCELVENTGSFSYSATPHYRLDDTSFSFGGDSVHGGSIAFNCSSASDADLLMELADELVNDPFLSFCLGGPNTTKSEHLRHFV